MDLAALRILLIRVEPGILTVIYDWDKAENDNLKETRHYDEIELKVLKEFDWMVPRSNPILRIRIN